MASVVTSRPGHRSLDAPLARTERHRLVGWYAAWALIGFAVPTIGAGLLELHHDLFLLVYFSVAGAFLVSFVAHVHMDWRGWLRTRLWWSVGVGGIVGLAIVRNVMNEASMAHPSGGFYWFELVWRGAIYGAVDALTLFVFPATVAYLLLLDGEGGRRRRLRLVGLTLLLTVGITATYHLGYPQFRGGDLVQPEIGAVIATVPVALTGNPVGAVVAHGVYHVAANVHTYRSPTFLPPDLDGYAERGSGTAGPALAGLWLLLAGTVLYVTRRQLFPVGKR